MHITSRIARNISLLSLTAAVLIHSVSAAAPAIPDVTAKSAILIEAATGKVLYNKDAETRRPPASTTKMMTLIVALEHGNLDDMVTASEKAAYTEGSTLWLREGEQLKMIDMLYGIMLISGNDATVAVAEHIAGSVEKFSKLMTEKAHLIGANNTNFINSSGLPDPNHYSTAHDLAKIAAYGYRNPLFSKIVGTSQVNIPWPEREQDRELYNENKLVWLYEGGNGVKTGYTDAAGRCLVSGAKRNGIQLIAVVLDSERMWDDSIALLDYGFDQVKSQFFWHEGDILKNIRVSNGKQDYVNVAVKADVIAPVIIKGGQTEYETVVDIPMHIAAPVAVGQKVGTVKVMYQDKEIASADLVSAENVEKKSFFATLWSSIRQLFALLLRSIA
ncbi:D-alanyl-D-alanine carboxypeptidase family protein [Acetonema longum]|uniref:serine-type D-Ala-D-Ala carboxypeptidase n=1 Tax=Acetonema longum DSM 6540 TaxID=1009370 RepID=F7NK17_9FIRM|nr:D-alanyl-D-alanine carboxypeptidase family protein [Acetonema longum]EGO63664.1 serine-type D-Ala-D-Ala carboxypeptidase [Acetonema longum DSM 6540]